MMLIFLGEMIGSFSYLLNHSEEYQKASKYWISKYLPIQIFCLPVGVECFMITKDVILIETDINKTFLIVSEHCNCGSYLWSRHRIRRIFVLDKELENRAYTFFKSGHSQWFPMGMELSYPTSPCSSPYFCCPPLWFSRATSFSLTLAWCHLYPADDTGPNCLTLLLSGPGWILLLQQLICTNWWQDEFRWQLGSNAAQKWHRLRI